MTRITYISDNCKDYTDGLKQCRSLAALQKYTHEWLYLAVDAAEIAQSMDKAAFAEFERGRALERKKEFAGYDWAESFGAILMPLILFRVAIIADPYKVPWGLAFTRLKEAGRLQEETRAGFGDNKQTVCVWAEPQPL